MLLRTNGDSKSEKNGCREGDLYKILQVNGRPFPLYYGYYDECDRKNYLAEPMPIYPDFLRNPCYTEEGAPFVTKMQDACEHYLGAISGCEECAECSWYRQGEELLGICACPANRLPGREKGSEVPHDG